MQSTEYEFDADPARIDRQAVWDFMTGHAYWGRWRTRETVERQIDGSWRVVGAYQRSTGDMVGFARAVSDGASLAYLADVYVDPAHRGGGLGVELVRTMIEDSTGAHFRWMLHTGDAHGLYGKFGFVAPDHTYLERPGGAPGTVPAASFTASGMPTA
jgi:GNAT superfamily N-acetyltransferase